MFTVIGEVTSCLGMCRDMVIVFTLVCIMYDLYSPWGVCFKDFVQIDLQCTATAL